MFWNICDCNDQWFHPWSAHWPVAPDFSTVPSCRCGSGRLSKAPMRNCVGCTQDFYDWFSHPKRGYYGGKYRGWFCYSCLENDPPLGVKPVPCNLQKVKIPPLQELVPPDYRHAAKVELPTEVQSSLDDFLARLRGIVECPTVPIESS